MKKLRVSIYYTAEKMYGGHFYFHSRHGAENKLMDLVRFDEPTQVACIVDYKNKTVYNDTGILWQSGRNKIDMGWYVVEIMDIRDHY